MRKPIPRLKKKGNVFTNLSGLGVGVVALTIILVVAFLIMSQVKTSMVDSSNGCNNNSWDLNTSQDVCCLTGSTCAGVNASTEFSLAFNSTTAMQDTTQTIPGWASIVIIVAIGGILIALVAGFSRSRS